MNELETEATDQDHPPEAPKIASLPTIDFFLKRYANPTGDDKKGLGLFKDYEPDAKIRQLRAELSSILAGKVMEQTLNNVIGKKRVAKYESYQRWAQIVVNWLAAKQ